MRISVRSYHIDWRKLYLEEDKSTLHAVKTVILDELNRVDAGRK